MATGLRRSVTLAALMGCAVALVPPPGLPWPSLSSSPVGPIQLQAGVHAVGTVVAAAARRGRGLKAGLQGLRCSDGIIITAGADLKKELTRIQISEGKAELGAMSWRSDGLEREWELPLHGEKILFTTPRQYAGKLSSVLVDAGARPVWLPTVRYVPLLETAPLCAQLDLFLMQIHSFDVIGFASRYACPAFWERMQALYGGQDGATRVLEDAGVKFAAPFAFIPQVRDKLSAFKDRIIVDETATDLSDVLSTTPSGASVLCVAPVFEDLPEPKPLELMMNKLSFRGLDVTRAPGYMVCAGDSRLFQRELEELRDGQMDVVGITSQLEVQGLHHMLNNSWDNLPSDVSVVGNGRETAAGAAALGLEATVLGTKVASPEDFVVALAHHCSSKRGLQIYHDH